MKQAFILFSLIAFLVTGISAQTIQEPESEVYFKLNLSGQEEGTTLGITGLGCREKMWVNVYAIAHFADYKGMKNKLSKYKGKSFDTLKEDNAFYEALCKADIEKTFVLALVRDVTGAKIEAAFREALELSYPKGFSKNAENLLKQLKTGVKEKDRIVFKYLKGGKLGFKLNKNVKEYDDEVLAQAVWRIYFCEDPTVGTDLRDSLINEIHRAWK